MKFLNQSSRPELVAVTFIMIKFFRRIQMGDYHLSRTWNL